MTKYENFENDIETTEERVIINMNSAPESKNFQFHEYDPESKDDAVDDPAGNPNIPLTRLGEYRLRLRKFVENILFRIFGFALILLDIILLIVDLSTPHKPQSEKISYDIAALVLGSYFIIEVLLRMYAKGFREFFHAWYNTIDMLVIFISYIVTIVYFTVDLNHAGFAKLIVLGRLVRVVLFARLFTERKQLEKGARHVVSQNKRRYRKDGFDLDLTYVTERVIAMSFPSSGKMSIYRNPITQVAKFMNTKHTDHYRIYNLCSERSYDTSYFHGRVRRFMIDDHNVPLLAEMLAFCNDVEEWLDEDPKNIIAVHCKGGKGRTGSMICIWLIHSNLFESAKESLDYFGERRTDLSVGNTFQGVETPSQNRYVGYFSEIHNNLNDKLPEEVPLKLDKLIIYAVAGIGAGDGSDMSCEIFIRKDKVETCTFGTNENCQVSYNSLKDFAEITFTNCPVLKGDIRIKFHCTDEKVPREYENCPFYFWFHTSFIKDFQLFIPREEIDNPHKSKSWKLYREKFAVELFFSKP